MNKNRLEILKNSLAKKEATLQAKFDNYFEDVKQVNGQPLNDKKNGYNMISRWDKKSNLIALQQQEIEKTKKAIAREEDKILDTMSIYNILPQYIKNFIDNGQLIQWRKFPYIFFVKGVEKARMYYDIKTQIVTHRYVRNIPNKEQYAIFRDVFNAINKAQEKFLGE